VILIATGSEVSLIVEARDRLAAEGIFARLVSLPCWELFEAQDISYREKILPPGITARVTVEEGSTIGWDRYAGPYGVILGMHTFGMSAPIKIVTEHFGFTADHVVLAARQTIAKST
jgi:transketolase